jgi:hypothetical protein
VGEKTGRKKRKGKGKGKRARVLLLYNFMHLEEKLYLYS